MCSPATTNSAVNEMGEGLAALGIAALVFGAGLWGARRSGQLLLTLRSRRRDELEHRGMVYESDLWLRIALLVVWFGIALSSLALLPAIVWIADSDDEARGIAIRMLVVCLPIAAIGVAWGLVSMRFHVVEQDGLTQAGPFREKSIQFDQIDEVAEAGMVPALVIRGAGERIKISKTSAGYDDVFNRVASQIEMQAATAPSGEQTEASGTYRVGRLRLGLNLGFLTVLLLFFLIGPWLVVEGDHPIRDGFAFVGIGLFIWSLFAFLVASETLPRRQPIELKLADPLAWRTLTGGWRDRPANELASASVETEITYVKGQPHRHHPLRLRFVDGELVEISDHRGRHLGSSTQLLGVDARARCLTTSQRSADDQQQANELIAEGAVHLERGDWRPAAEAWTRAVAHWPAPHRLALYGRIGELYRAHGDTDDDRRMAIGWFHAHVDAFPSDAAGWQAIAALTAGGLRSDRSLEAAGVAEQLLLSGTAVEPPDPFAG